MTYLALKTYLLGFLLAAAYDDLSYNKVAKQSPEYTGSNTLYGALRVIDGNPSTCMRTDAIGLQSPHKSMWWKVDLGDVYNIYGVHILFLNVNEFENRQRGRFAGFSLYVSNTGDIQGSTLCYKDGPQLPPLNFTTVCTEYGRYVIFYNERLDGETYPDGYELSNVFTELCEVIVRGCTQGFFGSNCDIKCPINCVNGTCHIQNGTCLSCKAGWTGGACSIKCDKMWYGKNCSHQCTGHCRDNTSCNQVTGQCDGGCDAGWTGNMCDIECDNGTFGYDCKNNCSGHCFNDSPCNKQTGHCDGGCQTGYTNSNCSNECLSGFFGTSCNEACSGHCINKEPCDHISGVCHSGCLDGYIGTHCNKTCEEGYYGVNCSMACSLNCKTCRHTDGLCSCIAGWMGSNCITECDKMLYGKNCSQKCTGRCRDNATCNHVTGQCDGGCDAGWTDILCDKECSDGTYGFDCINNCSGHCLNDSACDKHNGHCTNGCTPGFTNLLCDKHNLRNSSDDKDSSTSTIFLLISFTINIAFITCCLILIWGVYTRRVSIFGFNPSCKKKSEQYADSNIKTDEDANYQELGPPREDILTTYQNTILQ